MFHEIPIELQRLRSGRGVGKGGPVAFSAVGVERELRHYQNFPAMLQQGTIHLAMLVREHTQSGNLAGEEFRLRFRIVLADAQKHAESGSDGTDDLPTSNRASFAYPLNQGTHNNQPAANLGRSGASANRSAGWGGKRAQRGAFIPAGNMLSFVNKET